MCLSLGERLWSRAQIGPPALNFSESFGMTSLVVNGALLALCLSVNVPERA